MLGVLSQSTLIPSGIFQGFIIINISVDNNSGALVISLRCLHFHDRRGLAVNLDSHLSFLLIVSSINIHSFQNKKQQFTIKFCKQTLQLINPSLWAWFCFVKLVLCVDLRIVEPLMTSPELHSIKEGTQTAPHNPALLHYIILGDLGESSFPTAMLFPTMFIKSNLYWNFFPPQLFMKHTQQHWAIYTSFLLATAEESALHTRVCTIK